VRGRGAYQEGGPGMMDASGVPRGPFRFFEYGEVSVAGHDAKSRQAVLLMCLPCCLMQAVTPALLGAGTIDGYSVMNPVAVWIPQLSDGRFRPEYVGAGEPVSIRANRIMAQRAQETLGTFKSLTPALKDPSDVIPMLPLGTYVQFRYRCDLDGLAQALIEMEKTAVAGVAELCYALAGALARVLADVSVG
jgi:hypothetical protein